ncbi:hypothetical protein FNV43_RR25993 [Rhamnella rubrinervis]|uniref:F-box protein n=1 Tax=Rhamnella rubrinervis TaxID=2594499 RepID=A0A8K0GNV5_9ROSA|nr:hypothetical protein FNV43_RR25993 [Rhamnella rubrinervis]
MAERRPSSNLALARYVIDFILNKLVGLSELVRLSAVRNSSSNWESLHEDLIDSILDKLVSLSDLVSFSAVCKSWNSMALNHYKEKRIQQINHQLPWLVIQPLKKGQERYHSLYDLATSKTWNFQFQIPLLLERKSDYRGSSHGWLFIWDNTALKMFNPISGTMFDLPPFIDGGVVCKPERVTLSRDPSACLRSQPFEVLACDSSCGTLGYWKSGDKFWSYLGEGLECFYDFIFYKDRMLGVAHSLLDAGFLPAHRVVDVMSINIDNTQTPGGDGVRIKIERIASTRSMHWICVAAYLVETTKGDLLMVQRNRHYRTGDRTYRIYKVIIGSNDSAAEITPITNLDGECIFLGDNNHSISVLASNYPACIPNSIYYATSYGNSEGEVEVFNVEGGCFFRTASVKLPVTPWVVPSMKLL